MTAPERFADSQFLLHRGYLCHRRCNAARSAPGAEVETPVEIGKMNILDSADVLRVSES